jgi:hypothetical protein
MKLLYCLLPILSTLATGAPAFALAQGKIFKDPLGAIYVYGLVAGESVLSVNAFPPARIVRSDNCGLIRLRPLSGKPNGRIKFESETIEPATLPTLLAPRCLNGVLEEPRSGHFKTPLGLIVMKGAEANKRYQISWLDKPSLRSLKANKCGYVKFPGGAFGDRPLLPTLDKKIATFKFADLPAAPGLYCRNSTSQMWVPAAFPPALATAIDDSISPDDFAGYEIVQTEPPTISIPATQVSVNAGASVSIPISLTDPNTPLTSLTIQATGYDTALINSITFTGSGGSRTALITAKSGVTGSTAIQFSVNDGTATVSQSVTLQLTAPVVVAAPIACRLGNSVKIIDLPLANRNYQLQASSFNFGTRNSGTTKTATFTNTTTTTQAFTTFGTFTLKDTATLQTVTTFQASTLASCQ